MAIEHPWNGSFWGRVLGPDSSKYSPILLIFTSELVFKEKQSLKNFSKIQIFMEIGRTQSLHFFQFLSNFNPIFPHEGGRNREN